MKHIHLDFAKIAEEFLESNYMICAPGLRGVGSRELSKILKALFYCNYSDIQKQLNLIYKYDEDTIYFDMDWRRSDCENFNEEKCDCFLPDVEFKNCYCKRERRRFLMETTSKDTPEYRTWRNEVLRRDNNTCHDCGIKPKVRFTYHIKSFEEHPEKRYDIDNGITLCRNCLNQRNKKVDNS